MNDLLNFLIWVTIRNPDVSPSLFGMSKEELYSLLEEVWIQSISTTPLEQRSPYMGYTRLNKQQNI